MSKRKYVKQAIKPEPEEVSLTEFNRNLLHLVKTKPIKKEGEPTNHLEEKEEGEEK